MNVEMFRGMIGSIVVFRPQPQVMTNTRLVKDSHNSWIIVDEVEDRTFLFKNKITNHEIRLGIDNIDKFQTPKFVILRGQVILKDGGETDFEPFSPGIASTSSGILKEQHRVLWYGLLFGITVISIVISLFVAYRGNPTERAHFSIMDTTVTTTPTWPIVGRPLDLNFTYKNVGNGTAFDTLVESYTILKPDYSLSSQQQAVAEFEEQLKARPLQTGWSQSKDEIRWSTAKGAILTPTDYANLRSGKNVVFIVGLIQFRDDFGKHRLRMCRYIQPSGPIGDGGKLEPGVIAMCETYNNELDGWIQPLKKE